MPLFRLPLLPTVLAFAGSAGVAAAQSSDNPAAIDQLSIPAAAAAAPRPAPPQLDPATIAAQELELRIVEAEDAAFAAALLDALLNNRIAFSPNPPIFIPRPPAVFVNYLEEEPAVPEAGGPPQLSALRPATRPLAAEQITGAARPVRNTPSSTSIAIAPDCKADSLSWTPTCATRVGSAAGPSEADIKTLDDGVYVRN